jgi:hypothetical protein
MSKQPEYILDVPEVHVYRIVEDISPGGLIYTRTDKTTFTGANALERAQAYCRTLNNGTI